MAAGKKTNRNRLNLFLDIGIAIAFVIEMEEHVTGLRNHELLGLAFSLVLILHIILHWSWIVSVTKNFFRKLFHGSRFNYVLNLLLFIDMLVAVVTGFGISRTLGLDFGIPRSALRDWQTLHVSSSRLTLILVALHVAVHWKWIIAHAKKYLFSLKLPRRQLTTAAKQPTIAAIKPLEANSGVADVPKT
jgi:hypothetical protein